MFRAPVVFLLSTFLSVGPTFFERLHIDEVNRALARIPIPKVATRSPLKRLPVRPPLHDPATCVICTLIHSPVAAHAWSMPALGLLDRIGCVASESPPSSSPVRISCPQCRGPPAA
jgi:hypothetical protein